MSRVLFFLLRKIIEFVLTPLGFCGFLAVTGAVLRRRSPVFIAIALLYLFSTPLFSRLLLAPLERAWPSQSIDSAPLADAVVILSGGIVRGTSASGIQWGNASNRYFTGIALARAGKAPRLVLSAGGPPAQFGANQGEIERTAALSGGFPPERLIVTRYDLTTSDEAAAVSEIPGVHAILLVTSAFHMPRASMLFRARGFTVYPFATDQHVLGNLPVAPMNFIPSAGALEMSDAAIREYYGLAAYRTLLWISPDRSLPSVVSASPRSRP